MTNKLQQLMTEINDLPSGQLIARLNRTAKDAGVLVWERCTIAFELLNRDDFKDKFQSYEDAINELEDRYLADLVAFSIDIEGSGVFFQLVQEFPEYEDWEKHNFNLCEMYAAYCESRPEKQDGKTTPRRRATIAELEEAKRHLKSSKAREAKLKEEANSKDEEIRDLRAKIAKLEGKLEILEEVLDKKFSVQSV
jgi:hypothetical protein